MQKDKIQGFYEKVYAGTGQNFDFYARNAILTRIYGAGQGKRLLDVGASYGEVSTFFAKNGYDVYALEWDNEAVQHLHKLGIKATQADVEAFPYPYEDNFFDEVFWGDNIEHLFFPEPVACEINRLLKPSGRLVLSTPNHGWIVNRLFYLVKGVPRRTEGHKLPIWEWQHIRYFNKETIRQFLAHCGFKQNFVFHGGEQRQPFAFLRNED